MIKNNRWKIVFTSILTVLPMIAGLILWDKLPDKIATHWGFNGAADGWSSRGFTVFGIPLMMLAMHAICVIAVSADKKNKKQNNRILEISLWIIPIVSIVSNAYVYVNAMGKEFFGGIRIIVILTGLLFVIIGNYLPKVSQNRTVGIKIPTTLKSRENWYATHRLAGKLWVIGGLATMLSTILPDKIIWYVFVGILIIITLIPAIYSFIYKKKG